MIYKQVNSNDKRYKKENKKNRMKTQHAAETLSNRQNQSKISCDFISMSLFLLLLLFISKSVLLLLFFNVNTVIVNSVSFLMRYHIVIQVHQNQYRLALFDHVHLPLKYK